MKSSLKVLGLAAIAAAALSGCAVYTPGPPPPAVVYTPPPPRVYYGPPPVYYGPSYGFYGRWRR